MDALLTIAYGIGVKILGAIVLWIVGKWAIGLIGRLSARALAARQVDGTLTRYMSSALSGTLHILLIVTILGVFGVETTSFAAVFAAAGVAIGMAWSGLLSNFAAGVMMIVLRPFKVGDMIEAGGTLGDVEEVGLFVTTINTPDNIRTIVGNAAIFGGNIRNFSANPFRRVDLTAQLAHGADIERAITALKAAVAQVPGTLADKGVDVEVLTFNLAGPVLAVRPYCHNNAYWPVFFGTNKAIKDALGAGGFPVPQTHLQIQTT